MSTHTRAADRTKTSAPAWRAPAAAAAIGAPLIQATRPRLTFDRPAAAGIEAARGLVEGLRR
jgi:hypothetical protein